MNDFVAIVDLGMGNLRSVEKSLMAANPDVRFVVTSDADAISRAKKIVLPGQGAFRDGALRLLQDGAALKQVLLSCIHKHVPVLGICLGLQLLFESSEEAPEASGLSVFSGCVRLLKPGLDRARDELFKIPHMGWNQLEFTSSEIDGHPSGCWLQSLAQGAYVYFVHSYHACPTDGAIVAATSTYGAERVTAAIAHDRFPNLLATQFHPEKSQSNGLQLLRAFLSYKDASC